MQTPLTLMSIAFGIAFLDGAFAWELPDGLYTLFGLTFLGCLGYLWYYHLKIEKK